MLVPVRPRPQQRSRVVEVHHRQPIQPDQLGEPIDHRRSPSGRRDVVARSPQVRRVQAEGQRPRIGPDARQDRRQLLDPRSEQVPAAGRILQYQPNPGRRRSQDGPHVLDDAAQARIGSDALVRADVRVHQ